MTIALVSHPYLLHDPFLNHRLIKRLEGMGCRILTPEMVSHEDREAALLRTIGDAYWTFEEEVVGAGMHFLEGSVDGVIEPFSNLDLENELGKLGVEVKRHTTVSEWIKTNILLDLLKIDGEKEIHRAALPYLKRHIDGHGRESVGEKALHAHDWDGLIHVSPFT